MFKKDDIIIYSNEGVCKVLEVGPLKDLSDSESDRLYYKLSPIYGKGVILIPVDTKIFMRPIITRQEALDLVERIPDIAETPFTFDNQKQLSEYYQSTINSHKCENLLELIKSVYKKGSELLNNGKKLGQTDQKYMKRAEELLHGELAMALEIDYDEVPNYIDKSFEKLI